MRDLLGTFGAELHVRQFLGILELTDWLDLPEIYDGVADPDTAEDLAMDLLNQGRVEALPALLAAGPELTERAFTAPFLAAVAALCGNAVEDSARALAEHFTRAAQEGTLLQQASGAARLRALARKLPAQATVLEEFAEQLTLKPSDR